MTTTAAAKYWNQRIDTPAGRMQDCVTEKGSREEETSFSEPPVHGGWVGQRRAPQIAVTGTRVGSDRRLRLENTRYSFTSSRYELPDADETRLGPQPTAGALTPISKATLVALQSVTSLAWPILKTESEALGLRPDRLLARHMTDLLPKLVASVERASTPGRSRRLRRLLEEQTQQPPKVVPRTWPTPADARRLSPFCQEVRQELNRFSPLAWTLLEAQAERSCLDAASLQPEDLPKLADDLERSLARFGTRSDAREAARCLRTIAQSRTGSSPISWTPSAKRNRAAAVRTRTLVGLSPAVATSCAPESLQRSPRRASSSATLSAMPSVRTNAHSPATTSPSGNKVRSDTPTEGLERK